MENVYVHPTALVESDQIGAGSRIWAFAHVMRGAVIGRDCNVGDHCFIEAGALIGNAVTVKNANSIWEGVTLEDGVFVGPAVTFTNDLYPRSPRLDCVRERYTDKSRWLERTRVCTGATLGAGSIILAGHTLGEYCMIAAGALATCDVPAHALLVGSPGRVIGWICRCATRLQFEESRARCSHCGSIFVQRDGTVRMEVVECSSLAAD